MSDIVSNDEWFACGWMYGKCCELLDEGFDPRQAEVPVLMEQYVGVCERHKERFLREAEEEANEPARQLGYYWVLQNRYDADWEIAKYDHAFEPGECAWYIMGHDLPLTENDLEVVGKFVSKVDPDGTLSYE